MRIVFMGTPEFAVPSLQKFIESSHEVVGVVSQPDRPKGRGLRVAFSPVKQEAVQRNIPMLQPEDLKDPEFLGKLKQWKGECFVVVGFRILPPEVYEMPPLGTVNLHASLLPRYRGAAPIQWALIHGEKETGVTTFFLQKRVDTGEIIFQESIPIGENETAGELHDRLAILGAEVLLRSVDSIETGHVQRIPQKGTPSLAPKIRPEHCRIDWRKGAEAIVNLIRGLSPHPGAFSMWNGERMKIFRAYAPPEYSKAEASPGTVIRVSKKEIEVKTGDSSLCVQELQVEGGRRMKVEEFLRGHVVSVGVVLE